MSDSAEVIEGEDGPAVLPGLITHEEPARIAELAVSARIGKISAR